MPGRNQQMQVGGHDQRAPEREKEGYWSVKDIGRGEMPNIGEVAPDFELTSDQGERVKLSSLRGKRVILYFYPKAGSSG